MFGGGFGFDGFFGGGREGDDSAPEQQKEVDNSKFYEILGVDKAASTNDIRKQYKKSVMKGEYRHPDRGGDPEKFKILNEAHEILTDPEKRDVYDKYGIDGLKEGAGGHGGSPFGDIFSMFGGGEGGGRSRKPKKAKPKLKETHVSLEDAYKGKMIKIEHKRMRTCEACNGKGGKNVKVCSGCKGKKMVTKMVQLGPCMYSQSTQPCTDCRGQGEMIDPKTKCKSCNGEKIGEQTKTIEVGLEPGVPNEYDYVYTGESDEYPEVMAGDLYVRIFVDTHKVFTRKGADLYYEKKITLLEALTGFNFQLTHLDGDKFIIATSPGEIVNSNAIKSIRNKGMPFFKDAMCYGNLFINFQVEFPKKGQITEENSALLRKILPGPKHKTLDPKKEIVNYLQDFDNGDLNPSAEGGTKDVEEEEDPRGGQRVQCAQQ